MVVPVLMPLLAGPQLSTPKGALKQPPLLSRGLLLVLVKNISLLGGAEWHRLDCLDLAACSDALSSGSAFCSRMSGVLKKLSVVLALLQTFESRWALERPFSLRDCALRLGAPLVPS